MSVETLLIAIHSRSSLVAPTFFNTQTYDFCVKLIADFPTSQSWLDEGTLDRFLGDGFWAKLALIQGLAVPNILVLGITGVALAIGRWAMGRSARVASAIVLLAGVGFAVHAVGILEGLRLPKAWTAWIALRHAGRIVLREGAGVAVVVLACSGLLALLLARLVGLGRALIAAATLALAVAAAGGIASRSLTVTGDASKLDAAAVPRAIVDNVLLISIDSLRADRLGAYGNRNDTSPTLDRLARQGARFSNAMSSTSWTLPSHVSMMTGRDVLAHGVIGETDRLTDSIPTLAELMHRTGFRTGGIVAAEFLKRQYGFARGFDQYDDTTVPAQTWHEALSDEKAALVADLAIEWLRGTAPSRFLLFLHFWDVHYDYAPPAPYDRMFDPDYTGALDGRNFIHNDGIRAGMAPRDLQHLLALYDGEIRWVDDQIARLLSALDELGLAGRTAVIVTADHGDEFFEHGGKGHQRTLYREVVNVPLIVRAPGVAPGQVIDDPVGLVDLMPTILDLVGTASPVEIDGQSLVPLLTGDGPRRTADVQAWLCNPRRGINCKAMQFGVAGTLIHSFHPARLEFFAPGDAAQAENLAGSQGWPRHALLDRLQRELNDSWLSYRRLGAPASRIVMDKATLERLRALGYAD